MDYSILVNKENKIPKEYSKHVVMVETEDIDGEVCLVEKKAYEEFLKLVKYMEQFNVLVRITSAYRSVREQEEVMEEYKEKMGDEALRIVAPPGCSEHHTGLAIDVSIFTDEERSFMNRDTKSEEEVEVFKKKKEEGYRLLHESLKKFGFILRYPRGKEEITGYSYEPWHIRYVGSLAKEIPLGVTLEEYYQEQVSVNQ